MKKSIVNIMFIVSLMLFFWGMYHVFRWLSSLVDSGLPMSVGAILFGIIFTAILYLIILIREVYSN